MATKKTTAKAPAAKAKAAAKPKVTTKKTTTKPKAAAKKKVSEVDIRNKAQQIFENRMQNRIAGDSHSDWIQAEKELGVK